MTSKQLYEGLLIELHKENAPNILLEDFNYLANKAINQYTNKRYNIYDVNQQTTDDLRVLKATAILTPQKVSDYNGLTNTDSMATYEVDLPSDYLHILNCICIYNIKKTYKCYNAGETWRSAATRLTADAYSLVLDNFWLKPTYKRPYYYIHNIKITNDDSSDPSTPVNPTPLTPEEIANIYDVVSDPNENTLSPIRVITYSNGAKVKVEYNMGQLFPSGEYTRIGEKSRIVTELGSEWKDRDGNNIVQGLGTQSYITIGGDLQISNIERGKSIRYGNPTSKVRLEIRYGTDDSIFSLKLVYIDYIKTPLHIRLTQKELDYTEDKSQMLEFPDYVCQEILNELVHIVMENISDLRLQTHPVVSLSIANPAQALAPEAAGQSANN